MAAQQLRPGDDYLRHVPEPGTPDILPKPGGGNILITSALPYCNNVPHLGNIIGSTLSADVYSRYSRTRNRTTLYMCGTDEYGTATETQALKEGISPRELCDKYNALHQETYKWFDIGFDYFGRTSTEWHTKVAQEIYLNLEKNDLLEKQSKEQTYCEGCSKFLADRFVEGICPHCSYPDARGDQCDGCSRTLDAIELIEPRCLIDKTHKVVARSSAHNYFKMDVIQPKTEVWMKESYRKGRWGQQSVINTDGEITDARMKGGLRPTPVTRDLTWGVPVPEATKDKDMIGKVLYVWFEACMGYTSITANYTTEWKQWWFNPENVHLYQFMGKDNVYFHTVYWPSVQIGDGREWTKLHHVAPTEYLNYEGGKFSKSRNRGVFGPAAKDTGIPASVWRFYLLSTRPETADAMFSWTECIAANNNILLNNFGNFVNRVLKFLAAKYDGVLPDSGDGSGPLSVNDEHDAEFISNVNGLLKEYTDAMDAVKLRLGLQTVMGISALGNNYLQSSGLGNALMAENPKRCAQVLSRALNLIYVLSTLIYPFMPATSQSILTQINAPPRAVPLALSTDILSGHHIGKPEHLFKKIEESMAEVYRRKFGGESETGGAAAAVSTTEGMSKRKAAAAKKAAAKAAAASTGPKSPEVEAAEALVAEQGQLVRSLKAQTPVTPEVETELAKAIAELKLRKDALLALQLKETDLAITVTA